MNTTTLLDNGSKTKKSLIPLSRLLLLGEVHGDRRHHAAQVEWD